jgi:hypothetical protein
VKDAELLVYLVDEGKDIYIGVLVLVCHLVSWLCPAESLGYLGVANTNWRIAATIWSI